MLTIIKTIKFSRHPPPYHLSKRQKLKDDFKDSFELGLWISLAFLWITSWIIFEGTAGGGISTTKVLFLKILKLSFAILAPLLLHHFQIAVRGVSTFLSSCCSHCHLWYCLFIRPACVGEHCGGEVMEFSKLSIPFFAFKFPTWHKRSWLPAYITRPQEESHQNRLILSSVNTITNDYKTSIEKKLKRRENQLETLKAKLD